MALRYLQSVAARRRDDDAINRGINAGEQVGKLLGGLAGAIKSARQDAVANQLMTSQDISSQPGAGVTQSLGKLDDGGDSGGGGPQDLGRLPPERTFTNPSSGNIEPLQGQGTDDFNLPISSGGGRSVGDLGDAVARARVADSWRLPDYSSPGGAGSGGTVGDLIHTGGVAEMKTRQQFESDRLDRELKKAKLADYIASTQGTGSYAKKAIPVTRRGVTMTGGGDGSVWDQADSGGATTNKPGKTTKYVAGSGDFENDESTDNPEQIKTDFEAFHPNVDLSDFVSATKDANGNYVIAGKPDSSGNPTVKATIPKGEGDIVMQRMDAARKRGGLPSNNSGLVQGQGTQDNPVPLSGSKLQLRSLGSGIWVIDPKTGKKYKIGA